MFFFLSHLLVMSLGENHPAIECGRPLFAASARFDPEIGRRTLDDIAKRDLLVRDKSRQTYPVRALALVGGVVLVV
jgi:hypothetical protein